jgi:hypothetical protein
MSLPFQISLINHVLPQYYIQKYTRRRSNSFITKPSTDKIICPVFKSSTSRQLVVRSVLRDRLGNRLAFSGKTGDLSTTRISQTTNRRLVLASRPTCPQFGPSSPLHNLNPNLKPPLICSRPPLLCTEPAAPQSSYRRPPLTPL